MDLFPYIRAIISKEEYKEVQDSIKKKHFFMLQRFMSIAFPFEADKFNHIKINPVNASNFWHIVLSKRYNAIPTFISTKTQKSADKKDKLSEFKDALIKYYLKTFEMDRRDFLFAYEIFPDEVVKELKSMEKMIKENGIKIA